MKAPAAFLNIDGINFIHGGGSCEPHAEAGHKVQYSEDQLHILRQAAAILAVPVEDLPQSLRTGQPHTTHSVPLRDLSEQAASQLYETEIDDAQEPFQWPSTNLDCETSGVSQTLSQSSTITQKGDVAELFTFNHLPTENLEGELDVLPGADPFSLDHQYVPDDLTTVDHISSDGGSNPRRLHSSLPFCSRTTTCNFEHLGDVAEEDCMVEYGVNPSSNVHPSLSHWADNVQTETWPLAQVLGISSNDPSTGNRLNVLAMEGLVDGHCHSTSTQHHQTLDVPDVSSCFTTDGQHGVSDSRPTLVAITRPSNSDRTSSSNRHLRPALENSGNMLRTAILHGPCSRVWDVPPLKRPRRKKQSRPPNPKHKQPLPSDNPKGQRPRGAFTDQEKRKNTALTRELKACVRCRMQRIRCEPDPVQRFGSCLTCQRLSCLTSSRLPCLRYLITDASLYPEQSAPNQLFSRRWQSMDLVDITNWASDEVKTMEVTLTFRHAPWASDEVRTIEVTQAYLNAPWASYEFSTLEVTPVFLNSRYKLEVREFVPIDGDLTSQVWVDKEGVVRTQDIPPYAIADMEKMAQTIRKFLDKNVYSYFGSTIGDLDPLLCDTYLMVFKHSQQAATEHERTLLVNALRLWVACRSTSDPYRICDDDELGVGTLTDSAIPWAKYQSMSPIILAQMECILYTKLLRPLSKIVLTQLQRLVLANKKKYWLTIYLTIFVQLHSCSFFTRRDAEYARLMFLRTDYANPSSISGHHMGALIVLAHFHYVNKGKQPFTLALTPSGLQDLAEAAELNLEQVQFVKRTALLAQAKEAEMRMARETRAFEYDLYWVSQLFDKEWKPSPTA